MDIFNVSQFSIIKICFQINSLVLFSLKLLYIDRTAHTPHSD